MEYLFVIEHFDLSTPSNAGTFKSLSYLILYFVQKQCSQFLAMGRLGSGLLSNSFGEEKAIAKESNHTFESCSDNRSTDSKCIKKIHWKLNVVCKCHLLKHEINNINKYLTRLFLIYISCIIKRSH